MCWQVDEHPRCATNGLQALPFRQLQYDRRAERRDESWSSCKSQSRQQTNHSRLLLHSLSHRSRHRKLAHERRTDVTCGKTSCLANRDFYCFHGLKHGDINSPRMKAAHASLLRRGCKGSLVEPASIHLTAARSSNLRARLLNTFQPIRPLSPEPERLSPALVAKPKLRRAQVRSLPSGEVDTR
jgi:hypothetical protein